MQKGMIEITSVRQLCNLYGYDSPMHPLITIIDLKKARHDLILEGVGYQLCLYSIFEKKLSGILQYGMCDYDFSDGTMMFTAPNQVLTYTPGLQIEEGWGLFFHPDLLRSTSLGEKIKNYKFFSYTLNEALHISRSEKKLINQCAQNITFEYEKNIDKHTQTLIITYLELLLNYCERFYDRQFYTRQPLSNDILQKFESLLKSFFMDDVLPDQGLPSVFYFANQLGLSPDYLSDLLNKFTGKTTQEHIHLALIDKAKLLLSGTIDPVSQIAYSLGFEHASYFTRLFKNKTGYSPSDFRNSNYRGN